MIVDAYRYFFFRCMRMFSRDDVPLLSAVSFLSVIATLNVGSMFLLVEIILDRRLISLEAPLEWFALVGMGTFMILHYGLLVWKERYRIIEQEFCDDEPRAFRIAFLVYVGGSFVLFSCIILFAEPIENGQ